MELLCKLQHFLIQVQQSTPLAPKCTEIVFEPISMVQPAHIASLSIPISIDGATNWQQEIELVCKDLLMGFVFFFPLAPHWGYICP